MTRRKLKPEEVPSKEGSFQNFRTPQLCMRCSDAFVKGVHVFPLRDLVLLLFPGDGNNALQWSMLKLLLSIVRWLPPSPRRYIPPRPRVYGQTTTAMRDTCTPPPPSI